MTPSERDDPSDRADTSLRGGHGSSIRISFNSNDHLIGSSDREFIVARSMHAQAASPRVPSIARCFKRPHVPSFNCLQRHHDERARVRRSLLVGSRRSTRNRSHSSGARSRTPAKRPGRRRMGASHTSTSQGVHGVSDIRACSGDSVYPRAPGAHDPCPDVRRQVGQIRSGPCPGNAWQSQVCAPP